MCIEANATDDVALQNAGISRASHLITTLPSDTDNVFIALSARQLNPSINICSRASEEANVKKLKIAGVNHVIMPDKIGGSHLAAMVVSPDLVEFLDNLATSPTGAMLVQEILLAKHTDVHFLSDLMIKEKTGCTVIGYKSEAGEYTINPETNTPVNKKGRIIVLGNSAQIERLDREFGTSQPINQ
jgi:voltage-gated potassium channel